jgi:glutathione S-transferase
MKLYGESVSLFCTRVLLAARAKGLTLPLEPLPSGGVNSTEFRRLNPIGKMPVLEHDGECLAESEVILEYLEETQPGPALLPGEPKARARCRLLARIVDLYVMPPATAFYRNLDPARRRADEVASAAEDYGRALTWFEHYMRPGPFALGGSLTLADCALAPLVHVMGETILPIFAVADPAPGLPLLGPWLRHIHADATCGPLLAQYGREFRAFMQAPK